MSKNCKRLSVLLMFSIVSLCITVPVYASTIVSWMSDPNVLTSIDGSYAWAYNKDQTRHMQVNFGPVPSDMVWTELEDCKGYYECTKIGTGTVTGDVAGFMDDPNGSNIFATFSGTVTGGQAWGMTWEGATNGFWYQLSYSYSGQWTNGYVSSGTAYLDYSSERGGGGLISMTTSTPEPSTLLTLGSGILGLAGLARKRLFS